MSKTDVFFNEIYSTYYRLMEWILRKAKEAKETKKTKKKQLTANDITEITKKYGFRDSSNISRKLLKKQGEISEKIIAADWALLKPDLTTPIIKDIARPLTLLEKRWLKTLLLDPRIKLFNVDDTGLEDVEPLFEPDKFVYFDQYADGDDYNDADYQQHFKTLLEACEKQQLVEISFTNNRGVAEKHVYLPLKLEYSSKDDKFRLRAERQPEANKSGDFSFVNLGRITACRLLDKQSVQAVNYTPERSTIVLELKDERNALERVLLHFSSLEKKTQKLDDEHYRIELTFNDADRTEMIIRVLSFGPVIKLVRPNELEKDNYYKKNNSLLAAQKDFWNKLRDRINKQKAREIEKDNVRKHDGMSR